MTSHDDAKPNPANRFAHPTRMVQCAKLHANLPALKRKPMGGPLGERIVATISAEAWNQWVNHSILIINEFRLNPSDAQAQELLMRQCEEFLFGPGAMTPEGYVAPKGDTEGDR